MATVFALIAFGVGAWLTSAFLEAIFSSKEEERKDQERVSWEDAQSVTAKAPSPFLTTQSIRCPARERLIVKLGSTPCGGLSRCPR